MADNAPIVMAQPHDILSNNLAALSHTNPALAQELAATIPAALEWSMARGGQATASLPATDIADGAGDATAARPLLLASRYDPLAEARKLIEPVDLAKHAGVVMLGMGLGYHVAAVGAELTDGTLLLVYEPDVTVLRAVLERVDHSAWLGKPGVVVLTGEVDRGTLLGRIERFAGVLTQGAVLVTHPPTRQRHAAALQNFGQLVTDLLAYCRMNMATALVNSARTMENLTANLAHYVGGADTDALHNAAVGFPAVCVGAGPSLAKNIDLLRDPATRSKVVVIAAQTTLKPLLDRGIEPDFVTALDYHEISQRFYEGLPTLQRVTLVAEPKVNPAVLDNFPGPRRVTRDNFLNRLLGPVAPDIKRIKPGTTVAHLSFYLAQHLGCDPIILVGQDLAFSEGLYYCPGTAIHDVWAPELNAFNTVEMMEWQRIVRHRGHLSGHRDIHDQPVYSDEQMLTYLKQFERDFAEAKQMVIDATEGGLAKLHTQRLTLAEALAAHATHAVPRLPVASRELRLDKVKQAAAQLTKRIGEIQELARLTRDTTPLLRQILDHQRDEARVEKLFARVIRNQKRVEELDEAFGLLNELNTLGTFKRHRADRAIAHAPGDDALATQRKQLERDMENLKWLDESCGEFLAICQAALSRLEQTLSESPCPV